MCILPHPPTCHHAMKTIVIHNIASICTHSTSLVIVPSLCTGKKQAIGDIQRFAIIEEERIAAAASTAQVKTTSTSATI